MMSKDLFRPENAGLPMATVRGNGEKQQLNEMAIQRIAGNCTVATRPSCVMHSLLQSFE
jgi:hypothetical protein